MMSHLSISISRMDIDQYRKEQKENPEAPGPGDFKVTLYKRNPHEVIATEVVHADSSHEAADIVRTHNLPIGKYAPASVTRVRS